MLSEGKKEENSNVPKKIVFCPNAEFTKTNHTSKEHSGGALPESGVGVGKVPEGLGGGVYVFHKRGPLLRRGKTTLGQFVKKQRGALVAAINVQKRAPPKISIGRAVVV